MTILNADRWLYSALTGDMQLQSILDGRVYIDVAPSDTQYPFAVMAAINLVPVTNIGVDRVMDNELWQIAVYDDKPSYSSLESIVDRIREVLHKASGAGVIGCIFDGAHRVSEEENGQIYKSAIVEFRLYTQ